jgi:hypothetical protein
MRVCAYWIGRLLPTGLYSCLDHRHGLSAAPVEIRYALGIADP